jgi:hypothetical protein
MRETCARVLAAALMTGAIATVVGMSALFQMPTGPDRPIAAPPSSLQRSVRLQAQPTPPQRKSVRRPETAPTISSPAPVLVTRSLVVSRPQRVHPSVRRLASVRPKPKRVPTPVPVAPQPPDAPPAVVAAPSSESDKHDKEHGHGHDSDKNHKEHGKHED